MSGDFRPGRVGLSPEEAQLQPLYARVIGLQYLNPGGVLCFFFFEGAIALAALLALAELVTWWAVLILPAMVAVMVKINDVVAGVVARSAAQVPERERERFRREVTPVVGRASVPAPACGDHSLTLRPACEQVPPDAPGSEPDVGGVSEPNRAVPDLQQVAPAPAEAEPDKGGVSRRSGLEPDTGGRRGDSPAHPLNAPPPEHLQRAVRQRTDLTDRMDEGDTPEQRSRQSASRRYE